MKKATVWFRALVVGVGILAANLFAGNYLITASTGWNNGMIYSVPAGAYYEWEVIVGGDGGAQILVGGGGLNVNQYAGSGQFFADVSSTAYADNISYQLNAFGDGYALLYVGW